MCWMREEVNSAGYENEGRMLFLSTWVLCPELTEPFKLFKGPKIEAEPRV